MIVSATPLAPPLLEEFNMRPLLSFQTTVGVGQPLPIHLMLQLLINDDGDCGHLNFNSEASSIIEPG